MFEKEESAGYLANHLARLFAQGLQARIQPLGLAPAQFMVLLELWRQEGLTQKDLVARLDVEQATMAATLARMTRDQLIERRRDVEDGRAQRIHLTPRARELRAPAVAAAKAENREALAALSQEEQALLLDLMRRMITGMRERAKGGSASGETG